MNWLERPYRHAFGAGYFPDDMYREMLANLPRDKEYRPYKQYPERFIYKSDSGFWGALFSGIKAKHERSKVQLCRDFPGYELGPHTDSPNKVQTTFVYLTEREQEFMGTVVYSPLARGFFCDVGKHHAFEDFKIVKQIPFVPNGYFTFERSNKSFHGVLPCQSVRNTLQITLYA